MKLYYLRKCKVIGFGIYGIPSTVPEDDEVDPKLLFENMFEAEGIAEANELQLAQNITDYVSCKEELWDIFVVDSKDLLKKKDGNYINKSLGLLRKRA